jgi:ribose 5-phosphate isomerase RpiB
MGSMVTTAAVARDIVDIWLTTRFTEGWDDAIQDWLKNSMDDIASFERHQFKK